MAFQQVPNTVEITCEYEIGGAPVMNTWHAEAPAGYNQSQLDTLAAQIDLTAVTGLLADQSIHLAYQTTKVRGLDLENDLTAENNTNAGNGGLAIQGMPGSMCFCVQRLSGLTGRSARGRVFIAGLPTSSLETGTPGVGNITLAFADAYEAHVGAFRTVIEAIGPWNAVIVSRYNQGAKRATGITFPWNTERYDDRIIDNRRSRKRKV